MADKIYKAVDIKNGVEFYYGGSLMELVGTLLDYMVYRTGGARPLVSEEDILRMNVKALGRAGIKITMEVKGTA